MPNAYTDTGASSLGGSVGGAGLVQKAYDRLLEFALRSEPLIRSRRMDRINSYDETAIAKMPFQYELAVQNYLPAENPFAELQTPEQ